MIVLDTHAWLWWASSPELLSAEARKAIDGARRLRISAMSCWEAAKLIEKKRLTVATEPREWIRQACRFSRLDVEPVTAEIATLSVFLPAPFHGDPADRLIVATALSLDAPLVTKDDAIRGSGVVRAIW